MKKLLIVMMLVCSMLFSFTACDELFDDKSNGSSVETEQNGGTETDNEQEGNEETENSGNNNGSENNGGQTGKPVNPIQNGGIMNFD